jgi:L-ornithine N5-monooxygenase
LTFFSVNSIFNPEYIDTLYPRSSQYRQNLLLDARATNYGVVRLELIEALYERMYDQRRELGSDERQWPHRIMGGCRVARTERQGDGLRVFIRKDATVFAADTEMYSTTSENQGEEEVFDADLVISATGYERNAHLQMLQDLWPLLPEQQELRKANERPHDKWEVQTKSVDGDNIRLSTRVLEVSRDYRVKFAEGSVGPGSGIWLQGCCEATHGVSLPSLCCRPLVITTDANQLSDTLLSVLATRSGEIVQSIFGNSRQTA